MFIKLEVVRLSKEGIRLGLFIPLKPPVLAGKPGLRKCKAELETTAEVIPFRRVATR